MDQFDAATDTERLHREAALSVHAAMRPGPGLGPDWIGVRIWSGRWWGGR